MISVRRPAAILLSLLFILPPACLPQAPPKDLTILVLEGSNATNLIPLKQGVPPVVEVRDRNERPIEGAEVTFELPPTGASGLFPNKELRKTVRTNTQGQAVAAGFAPNEVAGRFAIKVSARFGPFVAQATIQQSNVLDLAEAIRPPGKGKKKWYLLIGGAAAGAGTGIWLSRRNGGTGGSAPPATPTVTVTPGTVTVGGPR
ncbi:MAG TPA: hypothetical protein DEH78_01395 [Solibacterales bacterium]|nr:hypothetical protein [Bryobacterales bacterium]